MRHLLVSFCHTFCTRFIILISLLSSYIKLYLGTPVTSYQTQQFFTTRNNILHLNQRFTWEHVFVPVCFSYILSQFWQCITVLNRFKYGFRISLQIQRLSVGAGTKLRFGLHRQVQHTRSQTNTDRAKFDQLQQVSKTDICLLLDTLP